MQLEELLDMSLREVLENYCVLYSPECCYTYGVATHEAVKEIWEKYDFSEQASMDVEPMVSFDVLEELEYGENEVLTAERIDEIIQNNLDIPLKNEGDE